MKRANAEFVIFGLGLIMATISVVMIARHGEKALLTSFTDDFYYYLGVAKHIAEGNGICFSDGVPTNGFHPLWLFIITIVVLTFGSAEHGLLALKMLVLLAPAVGAAGVWRLNQTRFTDKSKTIYLTLIVIIYYCLALELSKTGMEVALPIAGMPWFLLLLLRTSTSPGYWLSLSLSADLLILSRLDCALVVVPLWVIRSIDLLRTRTQDRSIERAITKGDLTGR